MAITFNDNIQPNTPKSLDSRYAVYESGQTRPYNNTLEVTNKLNLAVRYVGLTVLVGADEYWFKSGILDNNLVKKEVTINTDDFLTKTGVTRQVVTRSTEFLGGPLFINGEEETNDPSPIYVLLKNGSGQVSRAYATKFALEGSYIKVSPIDPQVANISIDGTISNSKFQVQANGTSFWQKADNSFLFNIHPTTGLNVYGNTPLNFYGATTQKMQIRNDNNGLVITNTANQTKLKLSDLGTLTLSQVPSTGPVGAPTLVRNPTTGNIELGSALGSGFVDLTTDQSIAGNKTFSSLGSSTLNGTLNVTAGSILNTTYSNQVAYWDEDGNLTTGVVPVITANNGLTKTVNNITLGGDYTVPILVGDYSTKASLYLNPVIAALGQFRDETSNSSNISAVYEGSDDDGIFTAGFSALRNADDYRRIKISTRLSDGMTVADTIGSKGLEEVEDYSANKTDYSYVTKKMLVVQEVAGILEFRLGGVLVMKLDSDGLKLKSGLEVYPNNF